MKKKTLLFICIIICCVSVNAQMRTLLGFSTQYDPLWLGDTLPGYLQTSFYMNPNTHSNDSSTIENKIFRHNGKIDSVLAGIHFVFSNDTLHIDTFLIQGKSVATHYTDSDVYIDYTFQSNTFTPTYRLTVSYANGKIKNYYSEYHQTTGWDGQMNRYSYKYDISGKYMGADLYTKSPTGSFTISKTIKRTYNGSVISNDSIFFLPTIDIGVYTYLNPSLLKLTSFRNNLQSPGFAYVDFDINNKAMSYSVYQGIDTLSVRLIFKMNNIRTAINEVKREISFSIYPNPTTTELNILSSNKIEKVEVYNLTSQLQSLSYKNKVDVSDLSAGIYFVKIFSENGVLIKKFIKQ